MDWFKGKLQETSKNLVVNQHGFRFRFSRKKTIRIAVNSVSGVSINGVSGYPSIIRLKSIFPYKPYIYMQEQWCGCQPVKRRIVDPQANEQWRRLWRPRMICSLFFWDGSEKLMAWVPIHWWWMPIKLLATRMAPKSSSELKLLHCITQTTTAKQHEEGKEVMNFVLCMWCARLDFHFHALKDFDLSDAACAQRTWNHLRQCTTSVPCRKTTSTLSVPSPWWVDLTTEPHCLPSEQSNHSYVGLLLAPWPQGQLDALHPLVQQLR